MNRHATYTELGITSYETMKQQYESLLLFQELLRESEKMNVRFHGKALEIAAGIQPWIDALKISLDQRS